MTGIQRNGETLLHLVDEILDLSKIEAGRLTLNEINLSVRELLRDVLIAIRPLADRKKLRLSVAGVGEIPNTIKSDALRLRQVLINLLANAVKFTEHGAVSLELGFIPPRRGARGIVSFAVRDTGLGIPKEDHEAIFRNFEQGGGYVWRKYGGTGLGLSLAKRLAQALGGDVVLSESFMGRGSIFTATVSVKEYGSLTDFNPKEARSLDFDSERPNRLS